MKSFNVKVTDEAEVWVSVPTKREEYIHEQTYKYNKCLYEQQSNDQTKHLKYLQKEGQLKKKEEQDGNVIWVDVSVSLRGTFLTVRLQQGGAESRAQYAFNVAGGELYELESGGKAGTLAVGHALHEFVIMGPLFNGVLHFAAEEEPEMQSWLEILSQVEDIEREKYRAVHEYPLDPAEENTWRAAWRGEVCFGPSLQMQCNMHLSINNVRHYSCLEYPFLYLFPTDRSGVPSQGALFLRGAVFAEPTGTTTRPTVEIRLSVPRAPTEYSPSVVVQFESAGEWSAWSAIHRSQCSKTLKCKWEANGKCDYIESSFHRLFHSHTFNYFPPLSSSEDKPLVHRPMCRDCGSNTNDGRMYKNGFKCFNCKCRPLFLKYLTNIRQVPKRNLPQEMPRNGTACVVCGKKETLGSYRKSGFKCTACVGTSHKGTKRKLSLLSKYDWNETEEKEFVSSPTSIYAALEGLADEAMRDEEETVGERSIAPRHEQASFDAGMNTSQNNTRTYNPQDRISTLEHTLRGQELSHSDLLAENEQLKYNLSVINTQTLSEETQQLQNDLVEQQNLIRQMAIELQNLKTECEENLEREAQFASKDTEAQRRIALLEATDRERIARIAELELVASQRTSQGSELLKENDDALRRIAELEQREKIHLSQIDALIQKVAGGEEAHMAQLHELTELQRERDIMYNERIEQLVAELQEARMKVARSHNDLEAQFIDRLRAQQTDLNAQKQTLAQQIQQLKEAQVKFDAARHEPQDPPPELLHALAKLKFENEELSARNSSLATLHQRERQENKELIEELRNELNSSREAARTVGAAAASVAASRKENMAALQREIDKFNDERQSMLEAIAKAREENELLQKTVINLKQVEELYVKTADENDNLKDVLGVMEVTIENGRNQIAALQKRLQQSTERVAVLETQTGTMNKELEDITRGYTAQISDLQVQLRELLKVKSAVTRSESRDPSGQRRGVAFREKLSQLSEKHEINRELVQDVIMCLKPCPVSEDNREDGIELEYPYKYEDVQEGYPMDGRGPQFSYSSEYTAPPRVSERNHDLWPAKQSTRSSLAFLTGFDDDVREYQSEVTLWQPAPRTVSPSPNPSVGPSAASAVAPSVTPSVNPFTMPQNTSTRPSRSVSLREEEIPGPTNTQSVSTSSHWADPDGAREGPWQPTAGTPPPPTPHPSHREDTARKEGPNEDVESSEPVRGDFGLLEGGQGVEASNAKSEPNGSHNAADLHSTTDIALLEDQPPRPVTVISYTPPSSLAVKVHEKASLPETATEETNDDGASPSSVVKYRPTAPMFQTDPYDIWQPAAPNGASCTEMPQRKQSYSPRKPHEPSSPAPARTADLPAIIEVASMQDEADWNYFDDGSVREYTPSLREMQDRILTESFTKLQSRATSLDRGHGPASLVQSERGSSYGEESRGRLTYRDVMAMYTEEGAGEGQDGDDYLNPLLTAHAPPPRSAPGPHHQRAGRVVSPTRSYVLTGGYMSAHPGVVKSGNVYTRTNAYPPVHILAQQTVSHVLGKSRSRSRGSS